MDTSVKATCNWNRNGGVEFAEAIQTKITHEDIFIKPELDEVIGEDRAILLGRPSNPDEATVSCELQLRIFPRYKIESLTLVCSASKLEIFIGPQKEYTETLYGSIIADDSSEVVSDAMIFHRYDVEVQKSGIIDVTLKLITSSDEICIYGILLQIAPNPNGITTLLPTAINLDNVQKLLNSSNRKLSPSAEKCKAFMQYQPLLGKQGCGTSMVLLEQVKNMLESVSHSNTATGPEPTGVCDSTNFDLPLTTSLNTILKSHIDLRFKELEEMIKTRLDDFETQQSVKLDRILKILEKDM